MAKSPHEGESPTLVEVALVAGGILGLVGGLLAGNAIGASNIIRLLLAGAGGVVGCAAGPLIVVGVLILIAAAFRNR